jgi:hypothetical protein
MKLVLKAILCSILLQGAVIFLLYDIYYTNRKIELKQCISSNWDNSLNDYLIQKKKDSDGKWILIDCDSNLVNLGRFDSVMFVNDGDFTVLNFFVRKSDSIFLIDNYKKNIILKIQAQKVAYQENATLYYTLSSLRSRKVEEMYNLAKIYNNNLEGVVNYTMGKIIIEPNVKDIYIHKSFIKYKNINGLSGLYDLYGKEICPSNYNQIFLFSSENKVFGFASNAESGLMNKEGKIIYKTPGEAEIVEANKYIIVNKKNESLLIKTTGDVVIESKYQSIKHISQNLFLVSYRGFFGIIDASLKVEIVPCEFNDISFENGGFIVQNSVGKGFYNFEGDLIIGCKYDNISFLDNMNLLVNKNGLNGLIDIYGREYLNTNFDYISIKDDNLLSLTKGNLVGLYSRTGNSIVVPCRFESIEQFYSDNIYRVRKNNKYGLFNVTNGLLYIQPIYDFIQIQGYNNYAKVLKNDKYGWIDYISGEIKIPIVYEDVTENFESEYSRVHVTLNGSVMRIRPNGEIAGDDIKQRAKEAVKSVKDKIGDLLN